MHANNLIFCRKMMDKAAGMQISVGFLDPDLFTSKNISQRSQQVGKEISNAMVNNYYVVGVVWTSLGPLPRWVPGPTTWWAPGTT
jgi:hypothetical protein